ncbi:MAG: DNA polymerase Y family protein, partial [Acidimicrobiales bacterium]
MLVAWFPDWPAVAAGCSPGVPAAVVAANVVVAVTAAARAEGVHPGLRRREAQGRCPGLAVVAADGARDARAWELAVGAAESLTPAVEVLEPGSLAMATRGPSRHFGGDEALAAAVAGVVGKAVGRPGYRVGVADGRFTAGLAARAGAGAGGGARGVGAGGGAGGGVVVPPGASRAWLAPHPVACLGPGYEDLAGLLARLGVRTLGELAGLPAPAVLGRFGSLGAAAHRLARGLDERPLLARKPPPDLTVSAEMDPPEQRVEAAAFVAKSLADELHLRLAGAGLACTAVTITAETEHGETLARRWRHEGALTAAALAERARWQLDGWLAGGVPAGAGVGRGGGVQAGAGRPSGGLILLRLTPEEVRPDLGRQPGFWGGVGDHDARAARAFARVQGLLGPDAVATAVLAGGRGPGEQVRLVPWGEPLDPLGVRTGRDRAGVSAETPP